MRSAIALEKLLTNLLLMHVDGCSDFCMLHELCMDYSNYNHDVTLEKRLILRETKLLKLKK